MYTVGLSGEMKAAVAATGAAPVVLHRHIVAYPDWADCCANVLARLRKRETILLLGERGAGKTAMLSVLAQSLTAIGRRVEYAGPDGLPSGRRDCLLVDDADQLDVATVAAVLQRAGACVLTAAPDFADRVSALHPHVVMVYLSPVAAGDTIRFVHSVLRQAGEAPEMFTRAAIATAGALAQGLPGRLMATVKLAMFLARLEAAALVQVCHVEAAAAVGVGLEAPAVEGMYEDIPVLAPRRRSPRPALVASMLALAVLVPSIGSVPPSLSPSDLAPAPVAVAAPPLPKPIETATSAAPTRSAVPTVAAEPQAAAHVPNTQVENARPIVEVTALPPPAQTATPPTPLQVATPPPPTGAVPNVAPRPAEPALPSMPPLRITVLTASGDSAAEQRGERLALYLREYGYVVIGPLAAARRPSETELHYFYVEDALAAATLATRISEAAPRVQLVSTASAALQPPASAEILLGPDFGAGPSASISPALQRRLP